MISGSQIRAARSLLDWTQSELAQKSGLSLRALNSIERSLSVPRIDTLRFIQETLEKENIEFGENDGVRRKTEALDIIKLEGDHYLDQHSLDIMEQIRTPGEEILISTPSEKYFAAMQDEITDKYFQHLVRYQITERLLIAQGETYTISAPSFYRWMKPEAFSNVCYLVYGSNVAFHIINKPYRVIIIRNPGIAEMFRRQFDLNWAAAEIPWFAKQYKIARPDEPWSMTKAAMAREWIKKNISA
jgi:transcriptional regulator with XRE-family HTH domain